MCIRDRYNDIPYLQLTEEDYTIIHGEGYYGAYLNEDTESKMYKLSLIHI